MKVNEEREGASPAEEQEGHREDKFYKFAVGKGVMNLPNKLTLSRVLMIPVFVAFFYVQFTGHYFVALGVFIIASLTDLLDGKIARKYNLVTNLGKFLDPIADKVLVLTGFVLLLTTSEIFTTNLGDWAVIVAGCGVALILAREIIISGFRMVAAGANVVIAADIWGKYKTTAQDACIIILLVGAGVAEFTQGTATEVINYIGLAVFAVAILLTVISGVNYIVKNKQVLKK